MLNKKILLCCLLLVMTFSTTCFAVAAPYASILAYTQNVLYGAPAMNTLQTLDIINMTPWDISFGASPGSNSPILTGMTQAPVVPFWMSGINGYNWTPGQAVTTKGTNMGFAFHSVQIALNNTNNVWKLDNTVANTGSALNTYYTSVPITFNSQIGTNKAGAVGLNFIVTSSAGLQKGSSNHENHYPIPMLLSGSGAQDNNNYVWTTDATEYSGITTYQSCATQILTIQAAYPANFTPGAGSTWYPVTNLVPTQPNSNYPKVVTLAGLVCPNYSSYAGNPTGSSYDLVVLLQSGNYADMALMFFAVPSANDPFYKR